MYRIFPAKSFAYLVALLAVGVFLAIELVTDAFGIKVRTLAIPGIVWLLLVGLTFNHIWRWLCVCKGHFVSAGPQRQGIP